MIKAETTATKISAPSCPSWDLRDESSLLWRSSSKAGNNAKKSRRKNGAKNEKLKRRTSQNRVKKQRTKKNSPRSKPTTIDDYYLRWNPNGDYDSDDDEWWKEVMAMEQRDQSLAFFAAKKKEQALYLRYKHHTNIVMEWGNASWNDRYGQKNGKGDGVGDPLSLRILVGRLKKLAHDGIDMPQNIYSSLEHAVELREEFHVRIALQRRGQGENKEMEDARKITSKSNKSGSESNTNNDVGKITEGTSSNHQIDGITTKDGNDNAMKKRTKQHEHEWVLRQLKEVLKRFRASAYWRNVIPDDASVDEGSDVVAVEISLESENSCDECSRESRFGSVAGGECLLNEETNEPTRSKVTTKTLIPHPDKESDIETLPPSLCISSSLSSVLSNMGDNNQVTDQSSASDSDSSSEDWDRIFGDDGSLIHDHETCDPQIGDLDIVLSIVKQHVEEASQSSSNPETLNQDDHAKDDKPNPCEDRNAPKLLIQKEKKDVCNTTLIGNGNSVSDNSNNSVRNVSPSQDQNESSSTAIKGKELLLKPKNISNELIQPETQHHESKSRGSDTVLREIPSDSKNKNTPASNAENSERTRYAKNFDSVWDALLVDEEEVVGRENRVQISGIPLMHSEPPENWEMLLEDENDDEDEEDAVVEKVNSQRTVELKAKNIASSDATPIQLEAQKLQPSPREEKETHNKHPNQSSIPAQVAKVTKPPYATTKNHKYDTIWDVFPNEKTINQVQVKNTIDTISKSATIIIQIDQPDDDWEALYS